MYPVAPISICVKPSHVPKTSSTNSGPQAKQSNNKKARSFYLRAFSCLSVRFVPIVLILHSSLRSQSDRSESYTARGSQRRGGRRDGCYYHLQQHIPKTFVLHNCQLSIVTCQFQKSRPEGRSFNSGRNRCRRYLRRCHRQCCHRCYRQCCHRCYRRY